MANFTVTAAELNCCLNSAADKLFLDDFRPEQRRALTSFIQGHDVFVNLPTGYGKSVIFQAAPFCTESLRPGTKPIAIVISPLTALIQDQLDSLTAKGIEAASLTKQTPPYIRRRVNQGEFSMIFASPEALAASGRTILSSDVYQQNLCGIFVDESHCVKKWGYAEGKLKAFREEYARIGELRSITGRTVPVVALTATATSNTRAAIMESLSLSNTVIVSKPPQRDNIKFVVVQVRERDIFKTFEWKLKDLINNGINSNRMVVYCRTKQQCNTLFAKFEKAMKPSSSSDRLFAKFHAQTDEEVKAYVIDAFKNVDSNLRLLFATVAFGMGIDVKELHTVIHYGPPHDIEEFLQESGRAGRDGKQSTSILLSYPGAGRFTRPDDAMRAFVYSNSCRRQQALSNFDDHNDINVSAPLHLCCDICAANCPCGDSACKSKSFEEEALCKIVEMSNQRAQLRIVPDEYKSMLKESIIEYRSALLEPETSKGRNFLSGGDIATGFPISTAQKIVDECQMVFSLEEFVSRYAFYKLESAKQVYTIVSSALEDCELIGPCQQSDTSDTDLSSSSTGTSQQTSLRPVILSSSTESD